MPSFRTNTNGGQFLNLAVAKEEENRYITFSTFEDKEQVNATTSFSLYVSHHTLKKWEDVRDGQEVKLLDYMKAKIYLRLDGDVYTIKVKSPVVLSSISFGKEVYEWVLRHMDRYIPCCEKKRKRVAPSDEVLDSPSTPLTAAAV